MVGESGTAPVRLHGSDGRGVPPRGPIHGIGRREIEEARRGGGPDLSGLEGLQAVCAPDGTVLTTYRNRDFRGLRR